ncbi:hypothetical protein GCM10010912_38880 [Paenibacillus albidus]|uniref:Uncharacterized protein n=1 Tax=Paenibacillus albidus TaxID=2041023 RepID=A0A917CJ18_9BACL|nr:hypothetical protein GCM10010912_38880 [Paenibacillus albidus]
MGIGEELECLDPILSESNVGYHAYCSLQETLPGTIILSATASALEQGNA